MGVLTESWLHAPRSHRCCFILTVTVQSFVQRLELDALGPGNISHCSPGEQLLSLGGS